MKVLDTRSLIITVDRFNEAVFLNDPWDSEISRLVQWVSRRFGQEGAYAGSFALTDRDWTREFRLFTGERITTRAARAHIIAEETSRMLRIIENRTGSPVGALRDSDKLLGAKIFGHEKGAVANNGFYCCGSCSVAFWRYLTVGGFATNGSILESGIKSLRHARDGQGGWRRFPFYYTLLCLNSLELKGAQDEIDYAMARCKRVLPSLSKRPDMYALRRKELISRLQRHHS